MENSRGQTDSLISFKFDRLLITFEDKLTRAYMFINKLNSANYAELQNDFNARQ